MQSQTHSQTMPKLFLRHIAIPTEHGSWVFLFSPLLIGLLLAPKFQLASGVLILAALAGFMIRQPVTVMVKIFSKRRPASELPAAVFWASLYGLIGAIAVAGLIYLQAAYILWLAVPGLPVLCWHLWLVSKRAERRQPGVEIIASGVLALTAPAAYWAGSGKADPLGWLLWGLVWLQSASSIVYAYLRLEQRPLKEIPARKAQLQLGARSLAYSSTALAIVAILAITRLVSPWLPLAFAIQWIETIWGTLHPALQVKPTAIGIRQLIISSLFTLVFILTWPF